ncbi:TetR/AcrR family transcriptional regulator [Stappia sp.]|uniref:TetR/AcrR family transcriptional regulator n=1 Tax=Stappia sp. TaxID=1870903 RepID=UPI003A998907
MAKTDGEIKRRGRPPRSSNASLVPQQIVEMSLEVVNERGLDGFSVRDVARRLGVYPTALYHHFPGGRNELLANVASLAFVDVAPELPADGEWTSWLRELFRRYRASLHRFPNLAPLLGAQLVSNAGVNPALVERILCVLELAGFEDQKLIDAYNAVVAALLGYVTLELAPMPADDPQGWASQLEKNVRNLEPEAYPTIHRHMEILANRAFIVRWQSGRQRPLESGFSFYVETMIAGLQRLSMTPD